MNTIEGQPPIMAGQVVLSMPGFPCLKCLGFLSERESPFYGDAGFRPQVVWANGVLASLAVGISIDLINGWTKTSPQVIYLSYESNKGTVKPHPRVEFTKFLECEHYPLNQAGDPSFRKV